MDNLDELVEIFASTTDKRDMRKLFSEILTEKEMEDIAKRWYLMKELYKGTSQRKIAKDMEISLCKITRGSKILRDNSSKFREILSEMYDEDHI
ncbi:MAG: transcriptional regulator [Sphaerochaetaceae bacterium]|mgnify:CR=1 FL=1|nr:transcriptional regulator [Sphaerochaetaceae bacterium]